MFLFHLFVPGSHILQLDIDPPARILPVVQFLFQPVRRSSVIVICSVQLLYPALDVFQMGSEFSERFVHSFATVVDEIDPSVQIGNGAL